MGPSLEVNRPRNVDWKRAAALLYGDWGTSKAYVLGLAFAGAGYASMPVILAVCGLTALVGYNYSIVCREFPDGGGVYSAAREQSRLLASVGALLLIANFLVTAALSGWSGMSYFGVPRQHVAVATMMIIAVLGLVNFFGPKHSGSMSIWMAVPTLVIVLAIIGLSVPHLTTAHLTSSSQGIGPTWRGFVGVILALSGVEAIANMTGVMKLDPTSSPGKPRVGQTAARALLVVAIEVVLGTAILGWAMLSLPERFTPDLLHHKEDMLRFLGEVYARSVFGREFAAIFGIIVGVVYGVLLLSAVNTAILAAIGVVFMMAQDGELPRQLTRLNRYGVPLIPLIAATVLPIVIVAITADFEALAGKYAIGVVGAITVNLGACTANNRLNLGWSNRAIMAVTFLILLAVELTIAKTNSPALFFAVTVVMAGLAIRAYSHNLSGLKTLTVTREVAEAVSPATVERLRPRLTEGQRIMVAARGITPVLRFALDEAFLRKATLCVLYVKEIAIFMGANPAEGKRSRWQDDPHAAAIMSLVLKLGQESRVDVLPVYAVSTDPAATILDLAATLGVDYLMLGAAQRFTMAKLLKGNVVAQVAAGLPEDIQLIIHG
ncbi:MAG TPA: universal stress protein [Chthoniobacteraceae bacterium]|nr:universal stress protein [Chthoniobacteraceae bacterium]